MNVSVHDATGRGCDRDCAPLYGVCDGIRERFGTRRCGGVCDCWAIVWCVCTVCVCVFSVYDQ